MTAIDQTAQQEIIAPDQLPEPELELMVEGWVAATDPNPSWLGLLANLGSTNSQRTYRGHLKKAAQILCEQHPTARANFLTVNDKGHVVFRNPSIVERFPWHQLRIDLVQWIKLQASVRDEKHPTIIQNAASVNGLIHACRGVAKEAFKLKLLSGDDYERIRLVPLIKYERLPSGRSVRAGELVHLVEALLSDETPAGLRDTAILGILYSGGLRRSELAQLSMADIDTDESGTPYLKVIGKGNKERLVFLEPGAYQALQDWLSCRGNHPGAVFVRILKSGAVQLPDPHAKDQHAKGLSSQAIYNVVRKRERQASLDRSVSPHDFRRSLLTHLLERGEDVFVVQSIAGHADPSTTKIYDRRGEKGMRDAANKVHFPYSGRAIIHSANKSNDKE